MINSNKTDNYIDFNNANFVLKLVFFGSLIYFNLEHIIYYFIGTLQFGTQANNGNIPFFYLGIDLYPLLVAISLIFFFRFKVGEFLQFKEKWFLIDICFIGIAESGTGILLFSYFVNPILNSFPNGINLFSIALFSDIVNTIISLLFQSVLYGLDFSFLISFAYFINFHSKSFKKFPKERSNIFKIVIMYIAILIISFVNVLPIQFISFSANSLENYLFSSLILYPFTMIVTEFALPIVIFHFLFRKFNFAFGEISGKKLFIIFILVFIGSSIPFLLLIFSAYRLQISYDPYYLFTTYASIFLPIIITLFTLLVSFVYLFNLNLFYTKSKNLYSGFNNEIYRPLLFKLKKQKYDKIVIHEADKYLQKIETIIEENKE